LSGRDHGEQPLQLDNVMQRMVRHEPIDRKIKAVTVDVKVFDPKPFTYAGLRILSLA